MGQHPAAGPGDQNIILDPYPTVSGDVNTGFDGDDVPFAQDIAPESGDPRTLVRPEAKPMSEGVRKSKPRRDNAAPRNSVKVAHGNARSGYRDCAPLGFKDDRVHPSG